jgi:triacylglycerol lipase
MRSLRMIQYHIKYSSYLIKVISFKDKEMRRLLLMLVLISPQSFADDCVVLLHGLGRTSYSLNSLEKALEQDGYIVVNIGYPSREESIDELSAVVGEAIEECRKHKADEIHFVTHSLGGILVRKYFQNHVVPEAKRMVMLSPPNHGSEIATTYKHEWWYKTFTGPAGQELGLEPESTPNQLKSIPLEIGIISGTKSLDPWFSSIIKGEDDGKVSVESAKLEEMRDFITVPHSHAFMAGSDEVYKQVSTFLTLGAFRHEFKYVQGQRNP